MSRTSSRLNKSLIRSSLNRLIGFRKSPSLLFAIFSLLIVTFSVSVNAATITVLPSNPQGWVAVDNTAPCGGVNTGSTSYVAGPGIAPAGNGSARVTTGSNGNSYWNFRNANFDGVLLSSITSVSYDTYITSNLDNQAPFLRFEVDTNNDNIADTSLNFEPAYQTIVYNPSFPQPAVALGTWQHWNAFAGMWYGPAGSSPGAGTKTWSQVLALIPPGSRIIGQVPAGGLRMNAGCGAPSWTNFDGNFDNLTIGVSGNNTTYDFEREPVIVVDADGFASATNCDDPTTPATTTVNAAVSAALPGDTIRVCSGTYTLSSTANVTQAGLIILGVGATRPIIQIAQPIGHGFSVTAPNVIFDNLELRKTDAGSPSGQALVYVQGNNFEARNNLMRGMIVQDWNTSPNVSRAFVIAAGNTGLSIHDNTIHTLRQPMYTSGISGTIANNIVYGTKGWVVEQGAYVFNANNFSGTPQNVGADIALLATVNPADYSNLLALSLANDNAYISAQFTGGVSGRANSYVNAGAPSGGSGQNGFAYQNINAGVSGALVGGTVNVAAGTYNSGGTISVNRAITLRGPNSSISPNGGVRNPEAIITGGAPIMRFSAGANPAIVEGFKFDNAGVVDAYDPGLNITLQKNIFNNANTQTFFFNSPSLLTFNDNYLTGVTSPGEESLFIAGDWNGTTGTAVSITNNVWENTLSPAMNLSSVSGNISGNRITNIQYYGILLANQSGSLAISNNTFDAIANPNPAATQTWGAGVRFYTPSFVGLVSITKNVFKNSYVGVGVRATSNITGQNIHVNYNSFINNTDSGVRHDGTGALDTENNWWGCNYGPGNTGAGCSVAANGITGAALASVDATPWLTLTTSATPISVGIGGTSIVTSKLTINSASTDTASFGSVSNNTLASFAGTNGTVAPPTSTTTSGVASTVFTATSNGSGNVSTTVDGQTVNAPINVNMPCVAVSIPNSTTLRNVPVTVPVTTGDLTGRGVTSFDFTLNYNPAVLSYTGISQTMTLSNGMAVAVNSSTPGTLIVGGFFPGLGELTGSGTLINFNFTAIGAIGSSSTVSLPSFSYNENNPCTGTTSGTVTVISGTITGTVSYLNSAAFRGVGNTTLSAVGAAGNVSANSLANGTYSLSGLGNSTYTVTPSKSGDVMGAISGFDAARISQHVVGIAPFNPGGGAFQSADVSGNGTITSFDASLVARYVVSLPSGNTGTWIFVPASRSYSLLQVQTGASAQDYSAILMGDVTGNWNGIENPTLTSFSEDLRAEDVIGVTAPKMSVASGSDFIIPVKLNNLKGNNIISYQFELSYQPKIIQPKADVCDALNTISKDLIVTCNAETKGVLRVVVFGTAPIKEEGILLNLKFMVVGTARTVSPLTFKGLLFNEGDPQSRATDGEIQISKPNDNTNGIKGQLLSAKGEGVSKARVVLTASNGESRTVYSDESGNFNFDNVTIGETYIISVASKYYTFTPQAVGASEGITTLNLIAEP